MAEVIHVDGLTNAVFLRFMQRRSASCFSAAPN
jgi:hypothetical protein